LWLFLYTNEVYSSGCQIPVFCHKEQFFETLFLTYSWFRSNRHLVASVVYWLACLPLDPRSVGSNLAEAMDF
jgi:hypothetical protein